MNNSSATKAIVGTLLFLASGPAAIVGGIIGVNVTDRVVDTFGIAGRTRIFDAIPMGLAGFLLGALGALVLLGIVFAATVRSTPKVAHFQGAAYPTYPTYPTYPVRPSRPRGEGLALGVTFVFGGAAIAVITVAGLFLLALSMAPDPL